MSCHISFRDVQFAPSTDDVTIVATTDTASHLWLRLTDIHPRIHYKTERRRGTAWMTDLRFCFDVYTDIEQDEAGDTVSHTWTIGDWPFCTTRYFYLFGSKAGEKCVSTSPTFRYHNKFVQEYDTGQFLALLEQRQYFGATSRILNVTQAFPGVWFILDFFNASVTVNTFTMDAGGDISDTTISHGVVWGGSCAGYSAAIEVGEGIYAVMIFYHSGSTYRNYLTTFKINPDGTFGGVLTNFWLAWFYTTIESPFGEVPVKIPGTTIYVFAGFVPSGWKLRLYAMNISADGLTVSTAGTWGSGNLGSQYNLDLIHISGERYIVFLGFQTKEVKAYIFNITDAGVITFVSSWDADAALGGGSFPYIRAVNVAGNVYALAYYRGGVPAYRVRTLAIYPDGSLAAVLDTNDALFAQYHVYQLGPVAGQVFMLSTGGSGGLKLQSILILADGTIAGQVDVCTWFTGFHVLTEYAGSGSLWCAGIAGPSPGFRLFGASHAVQM